MRIRKWTFLMAFYVLLTGFPVCSMTLERVADIGGASFAVLNAGNVTYVNEGRRLNILDTADPAQPRLMHCLVLDDVIGDIDQYIVFIIVLTENAGLYMVDVSDIDAPKITGRLNEFRQARDVHVEGGYAHIADSSGYHIVRLVGADAPRSVAWFPLSHPASACWVDEGTAYVVESVYGINFYDVSDPENASFIDAYPVNNYIGGADRIVVRSGYAYMTNMYEGSVSIYDVRQPNSVSRTGIYISANFTPVRLELAGQTAYAGGLDGSVHVLNIQNPAWPAWISTLQTMNFVYSLDVSAGRLYIANGAVHLQIYNVTDPNAPLPLSRWFGTASEVDQVTVSGNRAYLAAGTGGLTILNTSNPLNPVKAGHIYRKGFQVQAVDGTDTYVFAGDQDSLYIINAADPANPVFESGVRMIQAPGTPGMPYIREIKSRGGRIYTACGYAGFNIVSMVPTTAASVIASYGTPGYTRDIESQGNYIYSADVSHFRILDISDLNGIQPVFEDTGGLYNGVGVNANYAFTAGGNLISYSIQNPSAIQKAGEAVPAFETSALFLYYSSLFSTGPEGIKVHDIGNAASPSFLAGSNAIAGQQAVDVCVSGDYLYAAEGLRGLTVYRIHGGSQPDLPGVVTHTGDSGSGSLRDAIDFVNTHPGADYIAFAIPKTDPGFDAALGAWIIKPQSAYAMMNEANVVIDGASQNYFTGEDTNPYGPEIVIDGSEAGANKSGLVFSAGGHSLIVHDLCIMNFDLTGLWILGGRDCVIRGCYVGVTADGMHAAGNYSGISLSEGTQNASIISGDHHPTIVSGNTESGISIVLNSRHNTIAGCIIGMNRNLTGVIPNQASGIRLYYEADSNGVHENWIGGNGDGIAVYESSYNYIRRNLIGTDSLWQQAFGNTGNGILIQASQDNSSEYNIVTDNWIGNNDQYGVSMAGTRARCNTLVMNRISANQSGGIENTNQASDQIQRPYFLSFINEQLIGQAGVLNQIFVYTDEDGQGRVQLGDSYADENGEFIFNVNGLTLLDNLTAMAIDTAGNTSGFSDPIESGVTAVDDLGLPAVFALAQNFPNPFNHATTVVYTLPGKCRVLIRIYDIKGREMAVLVDREQHAGTYRVVWDAGHLSSGLYMVHMKAGEFSAVRKMGFLK
ncbi:right-handed parallel beta-helix repeat-containing protein [bacterium]|nr:right-handed parallel beta-helix repeat-containing protein [bacterium]